MFRNVLRSLIIPGFLRHFYWILQYRFLSDLRVEQLNQFHLIGHLNHFHLSAFQNFGLSKMVLC